MLFVYLHYDLSKLWEKDPGCGQKLNYWPEKNIIYEEIVKYGDNPGEIITKFVNKSSNKIDLIVTGSRGSSLTHTIFFGSTSNHVLHKSKIPVLLIKWDNFNLENHPWCFLIILCNIDCRIWQRDCIRRDLFSFRREGPMSTLWLLTNYPDFIEGFFCFPISLSCSGVRFPCASLMWVINAIIFKNSSEHTGHFFENPGTGNIWTSAIKPNL